jgi:hypothetical protein
MTPASAVASIETWFTLGGAEIDQAEQAMSIAETFAK